MIYILYGLMFVAVWTIASIWWVFYNLGNKHMEDRWYDKILATPVVIIAYNVGWCLSKKERNR